jgi:hypothetical protein
VQRNTNSPAVTQSAFATVATQYTYDVNGNVASKLEYPEYAFCKTSPRTSYNRPESAPDKTGEYEILGVDAPVGTRVSVLFDFTRDNIHYTWGATSTITKSLYVEAYPQATAQDNNIYCDWQETGGRYPRTIVHITDAKIMSSTSPNTGGPKEPWVACTDWYNCDHYDTHFKVLSATPKVTNYYWDYENRLLQASYGDGSCTKHTYDDAGMRVAKTEVTSDGQVQSTYYEYQGNNVVYEDTVAGSGGNCAPPTISTAAKQPRLAIATPTPNPPARGGGKKRPELPTSPTGQN